jgi:glycosyltransferase involved in cell wall biosynthesis
MSRKVICVSRTDKDFFVKYFRLNPEQIEVVENPVDTTIFYPDAGNVKKIRQGLGLKDKERFVLFFGQLDNRPAIDALEIIINKIVPGLEKKELNYKLVICGKGDGKGLLRKFNHRNVIFKGFVERIQDYINASDVIIVPLKSGSGTRMKILESLACGKRVVSTTIGAEGLEKNRLLEIEDDWDRFVERITWGMGDTMPLKAQ